MSQIPRGPGSITSMFQSPDQGITSASAQFIPEQARDLSLLQAFASMGQAAADGLRAQANIQQNIRSLKDGAEQKMQALSQATEEAYMAKVMRGAQSEAGQLLLQGTDRGMAWLESEARRRASNARFDGTKQLWNQLAMGARQEYEKQLKAREQEESEALRQEYSTSNRESQIVVEQLSTTLENDQSLQQELMGDGHDIQTRVENWLLGELTSIMPDALIVQRGDEERARHRDMLVQGLRAQATKITSSLSRSHSARLNESHGAHAARQIDAATYDFLRGETTSQEWTNSVTRQFRDNMAHLTPTQQKDHLRSFVESSAKQLATGRWGVPFQVGVEQLKEIFRSAEGEFGELFSEREKVALMSELFETANMQASKLFESALQRARDEYTILAVQEDGTEKKYMDPMASAHMSQANDLGISRVDEILFETMEELGLWPADGDHVESNLLRSSLRRQAEQAKVRMGAEAIEKTTRQQNRFGVYEGVKGLNPEEAYEDDPGRNLYNTTQSPFSSPAEEASYMEEVSSVADSIGETGWAVKDRLMSGRPLEYTPEDRAARRAVQTYMAQQMNAPGLAVEYGLPKGRINDVVTDLTSGDMERQLDAVAFTSALGLRQREFLYAGIKNQNEEAALRYAVMKSTVEGIQPDPRTMHQHVQTVLNSQPSTEFMSQVSPFGRSIRDTNGRTIADVMVKEFRGAGARQLQAGSSRTDERMLRVQLEAAFANPNNAGGQMVARAWQAYQAIYPNMDQDAIGAHVMTHLRSEGYRMVPQAQRREAQLVFDPNGHIDSTRTVVDQVREWQVAPLPADHRVNIAAAMGYSMDEVPLTMAELFRKEYPRILMQTPAEEIPVEAMMAPQGELAGSVHRSAAEFGGMPLRVLIQGQELPPVVSRFDITIQTPDGPVEIPRGTPISTYSSWIQPSDYVTQTSRLRNQRFRNMQPEFSIYSQ